ncbi:MAG: YdcF family protein [Pseudomonadota bacterium]|nr:YdcF family protein [Pseudomonadota bacterium]
MRLMIKYCLIPAVLLWFAGLAVFNRYINSYENDRETKTDAIIALTGGSNRIKEAASLLNEGYSSTLFISGVEKGVSFNEIVNVQKLDIHSGNEVIIERASKNTVENAIKTNEWIKDNNIKSIRLVTSNYHMPRSVLEFKSQNAGVKIILNPVYSDKVSDKWWKNWGSFVLIASEYTKFIIVYAKISILSWLTDKE